MNGYQCRHYKSDPSERVQFECWYCPELNCCVRYRDNSIAGASEEILIQYNSQKPDSALFEITGYRQVASDEFYSVANTQ
jgi:hypothetical protein